MQDDTNGSGAPVVTQDETEVQNEYSAEQVEKLEKERKTAITEAIEKDKAAKEAKAEATYLRKVNSVQRNPDFLIEIHNEDPDMAERIAQEVFNKSYNQLIAEANGQKTENNSPVDVNKLVDERLEQRERAKEKKRIEKYQDKFFEEKGITLGTEDYRKILAIYNEYSPNTLEKASGLLDMAFNKVKGTNNQVNMNNTPPSPSNAPSSSQKKKSKTPEPSDEQKGVMQSLGISKEDFTKYSK